MRCTEGERRPHVGLALGHGLRLAPGAAGGQREHQVKIHVANGGEANLDRAPCLGAVVDAPERLQMRIVEALYADGKPRDARLAKACKLLHFKCSGIRLQRDLRLRRQPRPCPHPGEQIGYRLRRKQTGRAATDEDRVDRAAPELGQLHFEIAHQRVDVFAFRYASGTVRPLMRIEVAVRALAHTPRYMDVERERRQRREVGAEHG